MTQQLGNSWTTKLKRTRHSLCKEDGEKGKVSVRDMVHIKAKQESLQFLNMKQKDKALLAGDRRGNGRKARGERRSTAEHGCSTQPERQSMLPRELLDHCKKPLLSGP